MHFIVPKNYNFKAKILGFLDYQAAILDSIWGLILYLLVNTFFTSINLKFYFFIGLFLPVFLISIIGINNENIFTTFAYIFKFYKNQKVYLFKKEYKIETKNY